MDLPVLTRDLLASPLLPSSFLLCLFPLWQSYKEGLQHRVTARAYRRSKARSFVFWMQNDAAKAKWPCTEQKLADFKRSFMAHR